MSKTKSAIAAFVNSTVAYAAVTSIVTLLVLPNRGFDASLVIGSFVLGGIVSGLAVAATALAGRTAHEIGFYTTMNVVASMALLVVAWSTREVLFGITKPIPVSDMVIGFAAIAGYGLVSGLVGAFMTKFLVKNG